MKYDKEKIGYGLALIISTVTVLFLLFKGPIPQDTNYHMFCDQRMFFGIPNFVNVVSNLPFLFVGVLGLLWLSHSTSKGFKQEIRLSYLAFFIGVSLVAIGSGYYHLWPSNETLVWDRMPMTIGFMGLFSIMIGEYISVRYGRTILITALMAGVFSVIYWYFSEILGNGDLRLYVLVQFLPILLTPVILLFFTPSFTLSSGYWLLLSAYLLAKVFETYDYEIFNLFPFISGHSLKHLMAAMGVLLLVNSYRNRKPLNQTLNSASGNSPAAGQHRD